MGMAEDGTNNDAPIKGVRHPGAEQQITEVLALVREVLGPDVLGAYLHGAAVLGGLRPRSDIDILVVSRRPTTHEEKRRLVERLLVISRANPPGPRRPVELTIVVQSHVRPWRYPPSFDFQYGDWLRREFEKRVLYPANSLRHRP
ncbi:MAG TPA: nucleotidyltransferase domain-containing protein [Chloroflexota bacterium]|nr:nucleotidyltransferase domain-containing protein [Chloroflexota bacterium]